MDHITDAMAMVDHIPHPAFCVKEGTIVKANPAALGRLFQVNTPIGEMLETGAEEYAAFESGTLYLTLSHLGQSLGACITCQGDFHLFQVEEDQDSAELQAMALAARELREPLANVMITADRLFPVSGISEDPAVNQQVARINKGLYQMLRVISNMSDAHFYTQATDFRQEVQDITALVDEVFQKSALTLQQAGYKLQYKTCSEPVYSLADAEKLERAILNMVSNALKFAPSGSTVHASLVKRTNKLYLSVQNSGTGITQQLRGSLFSRFTREPGLEDGRFGIGLGMVLIRTAAALHGGTVLIDGPQENETRITMTLAIRPGNTNLVRSPAFSIDYAGERDHCLLEFSESLPSELYTPENLH